MNFSLVDWSGIAGARSLVRQRVSRPIKELKAYSLGRRCRSVSRIDIKKDAEDQNQRHQKQRCQQGSVVSAIKVALLFHLHGDHAISRLTDAAALSSLTPTF